MPFAAVQAVVRRPAHTGRGVLAPRAGGAVSSRASATSAQRPQAEGPHLVALRGDRAAAVSYTFDDALRDHAELAAPFLEMFGFKGTFFVCPGQIPDDELEAAALPAAANGSVGWAALRRMAQHGHEVGSHGMTHTDLPALLATDPRAVDWELRESARCIQQQVGVVPVSVAYPFNSSNAAVRDAGLAAGYTGARTQCTRFGGAGFDAAAANTAVEQAVEQALSGDSGGQGGGGGWLVPMLHGVKHGYDALDDPSSLMTHLAHVSGRGDVWVAPFGDVLQYKRQLGIVTLHSERTKGGGYRLRLTTPVVSPFAAGFALLEPSATPSTAPAAGAAAVPMTVAVPAVGPNKEIFNVLLDLLPNGPAVVMPPPPSMTLLGQLYMHLL